MGSIYKTTYTKPLPTGAELFVRKGEQFARWIDGRGRKRSARVTSGLDGSPRVVLESANYTAKYRNGDGHSISVSTGCRTKDTARAVLTELETRADKVRSGGWSAAEDSVLDHKNTPLTKHIEAYFSQLRTKRGKGAKSTVSPHHVRNVQHCLKDIIEGCRFKNLRDLDRGRVERWANQRETDGICARTINTRLAALSAFGSWCVESARLVTNPFTRLPKRDEKAGSVRQRRALTAEEQQQLIKTAALRPIAEYGRGTVANNDDKKPTDSGCRKTWKKEPLTFDELDAAVERGRRALCKRPDVLANLECRGRERALVYKTLLLTGLRKSELAALAVRHLQLDGPVAYLVLDAADEKAGRGAELPLRADLAADLNSWLADALLEEQRRARKEGKAIPVALAPDSPLLNVPSGLSRILNRDLAAAGIPKHDDRGRVVDVHAMRHTFGTHLSKGNIAPRTAQAALRHGSLDLTMNVYTDPMLLDVAGALNVLPDLSLNEGTSPELQRATGTDDSSLVPMLVPTAGKRCISESSAGKKRARTKKDPSPVTSTGDKPCASKSSTDKKRATRVERATFSLEG